MNHTFKFLTHNKGESRLERLLFNSRELIKFVVDNENYRTTVYPQQCEFRGQTYLIENLTYEFDHEHLETVFKSNVTQSNVTCHVVYRINLHNDDSPIR